MLLSAADELLSSLVSVPGSEVLDVLGVPDVLAEVELVVVPSEVVPSVSEVPEVALESSPHATRTMSVSRPIRCKAILRSPDLPGGPRTGSTDSVARADTRSECDHAPKSSRAMTSFWISLVPS